MARGGCIYNGFLCRIFKFFPHFVSRPEGNDVMCFKENILVCYRENSKRYSTLSHYFISFVSRVSYSTGFMPLPSALMAVVTVFWDLPPCSLVKIYISFGGTSCRHLHDRRNKQRFRISSLSLFMVFLSISTQIPRVYLKLRSEPLFKLFSYH
jgi:hypothetical protein